MSYPVFLSHSEPDLIHMLGRYDMQKYLQTTWSAYKYCTGNNIRNGIVYKKGRRREVGTENDNKDKGRLRK